MVVGYNDSQQTLQPFVVASANLTGYAYSSNGGASFTDGGALPLTPEFINFGDPWLASDRNGTFYFSQLQFDYFNFNLDIGIAKSTNGGQTWSPAALDPQHDPHAWRLWSFRYTPKAAGKATL